MPDSAEPAADTPGAAAAAALAARLAAYRRGQIVVDHANRGAPVPEIAARLGLSETEVRARLREALARALPETPEVFAALQISRLNEALLVAWSAMGEMGLKAVDRVLKIVRALDRLHAVARPLAAAVAGEAAQPAAQRAPARAHVPDATGERRDLPSRSTQVSHSIPEDYAEARRLRRRSSRRGSEKRPGRCERNPIAPQPSEKAQNRSQTLDPRPASEAFAPLSGGTARAQGGGRDMSAQRAGSRQFGPGRPEPAARPGDPLAGWPIIGAPTVDRKPAAILRSGASAPALATAGA